jgi:hypothetical protein
MRRVGTFKSLLFLGEVYDFVVSHNVDWCSGFDSERQGAASGATQGA